jgi:Mg2+ and Co2+ transporter CorA
VAKSSSEGQKARRRAKRVALRTLQRVPTVVGENESGEPIVEVGPARLVLPHGAQHFRHLVRCSRCGRETPGEAVMNAGHLEHRRRGSVFCADCARSSVAAQQSRQQDEPHAPVLTEPIVEASEVQPFGPARFDEPLADQSAAVEEVRHDGSDELSAVASELARRIDQRSERVVNELATILGVSLEEGLQRVQTELGGQITTAYQRLLSELEAAEVGAGERQVAALVSELAATLTSRVDQGLQRIEAALARPSEHGRETALTEIRSALAGLENAQRESLAQFGLALARRLERQHPAPSTAQADEQARTAWDDQHIADLVSALGARLSRRLEEGFARIDPVLSEVRAGLAGLEQGQQASLAQLERTLAGELQAQRQLTSELQTATRQLLGHREALGASTGESVAASVDDGGQRLVDQLEALVRRMQGSQQELVAAASRSVDVAPIDYESVAEMTAQRIGHALRRAFDEQRRNLLTSVEDVVAASIAQHVERLAAKVEGADDQLIAGLASQLDSRLSRRVEDGLARIDPALSEIRTGLAGVQQVQQESLTQLGRALSRGLQRQRELASELQVAARQLSEHQEALPVSTATTVAAALDEAGQRIVAELQVLMGPLRRSQEELVAAASRSVDVVPINQESVADITAQRTAQALGRALEEQRRVLLTAVEEVVAGSLEQHLQRLALEAEGASTERTLPIASAVEPIVRRTREALARDLEAHRRSLLSSVEAAVASNLEDHLKRLAPQIEALGGRLRQVQESLRAQATSQPAESVPIDQKSLLSSLQAALSREVEALANSIADRVRELPALVPPAPAAFTAEDREALVTQVERALGRRAHEERSALANEVVELVGQRLDEAHSELGTAMVGAMAKELRAQRRTAAAETVQDREAMVEQLGQLRAELVAQFRSALQNRADEDRRALAVELGTLTTGLEQAQRDLISRIEAALPHRDAGPDAVLAELRMALSEQLEERHNQLLAELERADRKSVV